MRKSPCPYLTGLMLFVLDICTVQCRWVLDISTITTSLLSLHLRRHRHNGLCISLFDLYYVYLICNYLYQPHMEGTALECKKEKINGHEKKSNTVYSWSN